ncbi:MAG: hypothetical protein LBS99_04620 [Clostridiales bacterium]|jgi:hypothetical protein|nr:hypothetical protein [Clostridiales bacterium]
MDNTEENNKKRSPFDAIREGILRKKNGAEKPDDKSAPERGKKPENTRRIMNAPADEIPYAWAHPPVFQRNDPGKRVTDKVRDNVSSQRK